MPKCKGCGKFRLFFQLDGDGFCKDCVAKNALANRVAYLKALEDAAKEELDSLPRYPITLSSQKLAHRLVANLDDIKFSNITPKGTYNEFVVFDTETTGLSASRDKIIELAAVRFVNGHPIEVFETFVNPGRSIPAEATKVNHITDEMLADAPTIAQVLPCFDAFVGKSAVVAHNLAFDLKFVHHAGSAIIDTKRKYYCTYEQSKKMVKGPKYKYGEADYSNCDVDDYKLGTLCEYYNITIPGQHRAAADAIATGKLFLALIDEKQSK